MKTIGLILVIFLLVFFLWMIFEGIKTPVSSSTDSVVFDEIKDKLEDREK